MVAMEHMVVMTTLMEPMRPCFSYLLEAMATMEPTGIPIVMEVMQMSSGSFVRKLMYTAVKIGMTRRRINAIIYIFFSLKIS